MATIDQATTRRLQELMGTEVTNPADRQRIGQLFTTASRGLPVTPAEAAEAASFANRMVQQYGPPPAAFLESLNRTQAGVARATRTENGTISDPTGDRRAQRLRELGYTTDTPTPRAASSPTASGTGNS